MNDPVSPTATMSAKSVAITLLLLVISFLVVATWSANTTSVYLDSEGLFRGLPDFRGESFETGRVLSLAFRGPFPGGARRPLSNLSFIVESHFLGAPSRWARVVNLVLHAFNVVVLFFISRVLLTAVGLEKGPSTVGAVTAATLWGLNPFHADAALYVVQRMTNLSATFYLLGVLAYLKARGCRSAMRWAWWSVVALCCLLAVGSKENGILLPLGLLLIEWLVPTGGTAGRRESRTRIAVLVALAVVVVVTTGWVFEIRPARLLDSWWKPRGREFDMLSRLLTEGRVLVDYLSRFFLPLPSRLAFVLKHELSQSLLSPWTTLVSWAAIAASIVLAVRYRRKHPLVALAVLWFFSNHVLESTILPLEIAFVHRNYLPTALLLLPLAGFLATKRTQWAPGRVALLFVLALIALGSGWHQRAKVWSGPERFWEDAIAKAPGSLRGYINLGVLRDIQGRPEDAMVIYERGAANAIEETPASWSSLYCCMGIAEMNRGELERAETLMTRAESFAPLPDCLINHSKLHILRGDAESAMRVLDRLQTIRPEHRKLHLQRARALALAGQFEAAVLEAREELRRYPDNHEATQLIQWIRDSGH